MKKVLRSIVIKGGNTATALEAPPFYPEPPPTHMVHRSAEEFTPKPEKYAAKREKGGWKFPPVSEARLTVWQDLGRLPEIGWFEIIHNNSPFMAKRNTKEAVLLRVSAQTKVVFG